MTREVLRLGPSGHDDVITRAHLGDPAAWSALYQEHDGRLRVWLRSRPLVDPATHTDDIAAEAWLTAASKFGEFSGTSHDFAGWLFAIARNLALNAHRRSVRRATSPADAHADDPLWGSAPNPTDDVDSSDVTRRLLARLPRREAEVVACIDVVGLDSASTARALGISTAAVRVARHRGLRRLRMILTEAEVAVPAGTKRARGSQPTAAPARPL